MNFFGHASVASWTAESSGSVLGAMLPDFATMSGARLAEPTDEAVARGIDLHHDTDAAFHHLPTVLELMRELDGRLQRAHCARGPRRAVAHIGVELLLDGVLVDEPAYRDNYLAGLGHDPSGVRWKHDGDDARFAMLLARLRAHGVPVDLRKPESIANRLHRMLIHRPLLAPSSSDMVAIKHCLDEQQRSVTLATDNLLAELRAELEAV